MDNTEMFKMLLNKIDEQSQEIAKLNFIINSFKKNNISAKQELDKIFNPENFRFGKQTNLSAQDRIKEIMAQRNKK